MKFKVGDFIVWGSGIETYYEKILEVNEVKNYYRFVEITIGHIGSWKLDWIDKHARLMTDEEKAELL